MCKIGKIVFGRIGPGSAFFRKRNFGQKVFGQISKGAELLTFKEIYYTKWLRKAVPRPPPHILF
jgi:hypothetical protein